MPQPLGELLIPAFVFFFFFFSSIRRAGWPIRPAARGAAGGWRADPGRAIVGDRGIEPSAARLSTIARLARKGQVVGTGVARTGSACDEHPLVTGSWAAIWEGSFAPRLRPARLFDAHSVLTLLMLILTYLAPAFLVLSSGPAACCAGAVSHFFLLGNEH